MSVPEAGTGTGVPTVGRDHRFHRLAVRRVVPETADSASFVLEVPPELETAFRYQAGQFCTFRATIDGQAHLRSYSMSSAPEVDDELQVTVKRVSGGVFSNWMIDSLGPGDQIEATCPAGVFTLRDDGADLAVLAGGSGITPILSLVKSSLARPGGRVRLLHANRELAAEIFSDALEGLRARHPDRLEIVKHYDSQRGLVHAAEVCSFVGGSGDAEFYLCGPAPFMALAEKVLSERGVAPERVHVERFTPPDAAAPDAAPAVAPEAAGPVRVTIELGGRTAAADHRPGTTILQTARQLGMSPPFSCESGSCATCMARLVEGAVAMRVNDALTDEEVAEGWILTCQSVPATPTVRVVYEDA